MVPEVRLVTLEQLYCKVTVLSIAFLQERARCAIVADRLDLLPEKASPDQMLLEQKQEVAYDELLMRVPAIHSSPPPRLFCYNSAKVSLSTPVLTPGIHPVSVSNPSPSGDFNILQKSHKICYPIPEFSCA